MAGEVKTGLSGQGQAAASDLYSVAKGWLAQHPAVSGTALRGAAALGGPTALGAVEYLSQPKAAGPAAPPPVAPDAAAGAVDPSAAGGQGANPWDSTFGTVTPGPPPQGGGFQLTPPRLMPARFDDSRVPLRRETQAQLAGALDNSRTIEATYDLADVQRNAAIASANLLEGEAERARIESARRMDREQERQTMVRSQLDKARQLNEEAQKATVDPTRFWKNPGTILMSIGAVLSTNGEGTHTLERAQEMDLANQKAEIQLKRERGLQAENTLAKYQQAFGDERAAELAFEADSRDIARMKLMALAERSQSPQIMAQAQLVASGLAEKRDASLAEFKSRLDQMSYVPAHVVGGGMGAQQKPLENVVNLPNGVSLKMPSSKLQETAVERIAATEQIKRNNDRALKLNKEREQAVMRGEVSRALAIDNELEALQASSVNMRSLAQGQGVVKEAEMDRGKKDFPYRTLNSEALKTIQNNTTLAVQDLGMWMRASGAEQVQRGYTADAQGRVQPTGAFVGHNVGPQSVEDPKTFQLMTPQVGKR